jgi:hypothetical protein
MKNNCYKGAKTKLGIHKDFYMSLLTKGYTRSLNVQRPINCNEAELLIEFVYGMKLKVEFENFTNKLKVSGWGFDDKQVQREIAIARLEGVDHITYIDNWAGHKEPIEKKKAIGRFRWHIGRNINHSDYQDYHFNKETLNSSYEIESTVIPSTIFGPRGSGGIGYGDTEITSFSELEHIEHMYLNKNEPARPEYIEYIKSLEKKNKIYQYNDLKVKVCQFELETV